MKLAHRGVNAETASMLEVTEQEINNRHFRQSQEFAYVRHIPTPQVITRKFRPTTDTTNSTLVSNRPQALDELTILT